MNHATQLREELAECMTWILFITGVSKHPGYFLFGSDRCSAKPRTPETAGISSVFAFWITKTVSKTEFSFCPFVGKM